ncbi:MAG TPA: AGE family epimerase/isomerase, partial [Chloroflexota bacterium]|nr:AGE family epimerase/isomerase [Chloroflexota bacterium]
TALRYGDLTGETQFSAPAMDLVDRCWRYGYDGETGRWLHQVPRLHSENVPDTPHHRRTPWWVQQYGNYLALFAYHVTGEARYLEVFQRAAAFWDAHFVDRRHGGEFLNVAIQPGGEVTGEKRPESAYHSMEHALLVSLYLDLFVTKQPATLHFRVQSPGPGSVYPVFPIESPEVKLTGVTVQGEPWERFDAGARSVTLPQGDDVPLAVTLEGR